MRERKGKNQPTESSSCHTIAEISKSRFQVCKERQISTRETPKWLVVVAGRFPVCHFHLIYHLFSPSFDICHVFCSLCVTVYSVWCSWWLRVIKCVPFLLHTLRLEGTWTTYPFLTLLYSFSIPTLIDFFSAVCNNPSLTHMKNSTICRKSSTKMVQNNSMREVRERQWLNLPPICRNRLNDSFGLLLCLPLLFNVLAK